MSLDIEHKVFFSYYPLLLILKDDYNVSGGTRRNSAEERNPWASYHTLP